jgi:hypothetical protein
MKKKVIFPKDLYVWEDVQNDPPCLIVDPDFKGFARTDEDVTVGVYRLVRVATVKNRSVLE